MKMQFCGCLLASCLLIISGDAFSVQQQTAGMELFRPASRAPLAPPGPGEEVKEEMKKEEVKEEVKKELKEEVKKAVLRLEDPVRTENDVMEPKKKRSFSGTNQLDRLSVSSMETKQGGAKPSRAVESPRRRVNPPPVDRIGMSRLPNSRG